ncbi:hypothetical protein B0H19DRAFT_945480 [Mycena capillaripes]|nr:hypothetical protein B0H19DRAFT_945480 [Mycena capillaripes]
MVCGSTRFYFVIQPLSIVGQLSLFVADFFQSLGVVLDVKWVNDGIVGVGGLCTAQGVLQNIGQAGVAMTTFIITLHTFDILWRGESISLGRAYILIGNVWAFLILTITISASVHQNPSFYAPTPYWCWINSSYPEYRIALENFWLWIGFAVSVLYIPLLFWDAGLVKPRNPQWWTFELNPSDAQPSRRRFKLIMYVLRSCALAYCLPVIPTALARWFLVVHGDVKPFATAEAQFIVKGIFSLSGVCDVVAFKFARSGLLLFPSHDSPEETAPKADDGSDDISLADMNSGGNAQNASVTPKPWWRHQRRIRANSLLPHRPILMCYLVFLCFWIVVNVLDIVWITYCEFIYE